MGDKKAQIISRTTVVVIVLIISFVVLFMLITRISWKKNIDLDTCHNSMLESHTANVGNVGAELFPLRCETQKICFVVSGLSSYTDNCDFAFKGEKDIIKIKVVNKEDLIKEINELSVTFWAANGEGYLDYHTIEKKNHCAFWARIAFSKKVQEEIASEISYKELYQAMQSTRVKGKEISQLSYIYKGINTIEELRIGFLENPPKNPGTGEEVISDIYKIKLNTSQQYLVVTLLHRNKEFSDMKTAAGIGIGIGAAFTVVTGGFGGIFLPAIAGGTAGFISTYMAIDETVVAPPFFWPYNPEDIKQLKCGAYDFIT